MSPDPADIPREPRKPRTRIIVATTGTRGDIVPFLAMAQALAEKGHEVVVLVPAFHAPLVRAHGLECETFGAATDYDAIIGDPLLWDERKGFGVVWKALVPYLDAIRDLAARQEGLDRLVVLCHPILCPMADIARTARPDLRVVCGYLAPSNLCSSHDLLTVGSTAVPAWLPMLLRRSLWALAFKFWIDPDTLPGLNAFRQSIGLPRVTSFRQQLHGVADVSLALFPPWFASRQVDWPSPFLEGDFPGSMSEPGRPPDASLERFLAEGPAPIAFTPGTGHRHAARYFATALEALALAGRRGLFVTPFADQVPENLPAEVHWVDHAPFESLLPRVGALVHHGGIGTTAQAFACGIPQLIVPYAFDQFDNGLRARRLGVADVLLPGKMTEKRLAERLVALTSSRAVAQSCAEVAERSRRGAGLLAQLDPAIG